MRDSANNQAAQTAETGKEAAVASSDLVLPLSWRSVAHGFTAENLVLTVFGIAMLIVAMKFLFLG